jgi:hypothetical protein
MSGHTLRAFNDADATVIRRALRGGWAVYTLEDHVEHLFTVASDDEGLIELIAGQLSLPAPALQAHPSPPTPRPEAKPAEALQPSPADPALAAIRDALAPFAEFAEKTATVDRGSYFAIRVLEDSEGYAEVSMADLHDLLRAAGLWTDKMQAPAPNPGPAPAAGAAAPAPAATDSDDLQTVEVGAADGDDSYPPACSDPGGHKFEGTGTAYGGVDERWQGEGRMLCIHCGADGDA